MIAAAIVAIMALFTAGALTALLAALTTAACDVTTRAGQPRVHPTVALPEEYSNQ